MGFGRRAAMPHPPRLPGYRLRFDFRAAFPSLTVEA